MPRTSHVFCILESKSFLFRNCHSHLLLRSRTKAEKDYVTEKLMPATAAVLARSIKVRAPSMSCDTLLTCRWHCQVGCSKIWRHRTRMRIPKAHYHRRAVTNESYCVHLIKKVSPVISLGMTHSMIPFMYKRHEAVAGPKSFWTIDVGRNAGLL